MGDGSEMRSPVCSLPDTDVRHWRVIIVLAKTFELHAAGKTKVIAEVRKLEQVNEAFEEVETGKARARLVFDFR
jgi:hypothetical protein